LREEKKKEILDLTKKRYLPLKQYPKDKRKDVSFSLIDIGGRRGEKERRNAPTPGSLRGLRSCLRKKLPLSFFYEKGKGRKEGRGGG